MARRRSTDQYSDCEPVRGFAICQNSSANRLDRLKRSLELTLKAVHVDPIGQNTGFVTPGPGLLGPKFLLFRTMHELIRNTFSRRKLHQLCVNTALGNFVGYVAGSLVMLMTTYQTVERRALKNLFGILPRETVVVHRLPEWLEWTLCVLLGYIVMESVRYFINNNKYLRLVAGTTPDQTRPRDDGEQRTTNG